MQTFLMLLVLAIQTTITGSIFPSPTRQPPPIRTPTPAATSTPTPTASPTPLPTNTPVPSPTPSDGPILLGNWYAGQGPNSVEAEAADALQALNIIGARTRLFWPESSSTEPWAWWDPEIGYHSDADRLVLLEWWDWRPPNGRHISNGDCSTSSLADYRSFAHDIAVRYDGHLYAVQPENEPDMCNEPIVTADRVAIVYEEFKSVNPSVLVVSPGLAYDNFLPSDAPPGYPNPGGPYRYSHLTAFLNRLATKSCAPCVDAWAVHRYPGFPFWGSIAAKAADIRSRLAPFGWNGMSMWATEIGAPAWDGNWTPDAQADWVLADMESARDDGFAAAFGYSTLDQYPQTFGFYDNFGGTPLPRPVATVVGGMPR